MGSGVLIMKFPPSQLALHVLGGMKGIEVGGSAHNPFGLDTLNVDWTDRIDTACKREEITMCGETLKVDVVADGSHLPFEDGQWDFVISSQSLEHNWNLIAALKEWLRVVRVGGMVFVIFPHPDRTPDKGRPRTTLAELVGRYHGETQRPTQVNPEWPKWSLESGGYYDAHHTVWLPEDAVECAKYIGGNEIVELQDPDDKVGNGFTFVLKKL